MFFQKRTCCDPQLPHSTSLQALPEADHKFLIGRPFFLITLALASRFSEVHALIFAELWFEDSYSFAVYTTLPEYQPETNRHLLWVIWLEDSMKTDYCVLFAL